jgi:xanthine dehydrogenase accessory factor
LKQKGMAEELIARVHSPMGLELNAETPEEIAVSIMAEILMIRDKGTGKAMRSGVQSRKAGWRLGRS